MAILRNTTKHNDLVSPTNNMKSMPNYLLMYRGHYTLPYHTTAIYLAMYRAPILGTIR